MTPNKFLTACVDDKTDLACKRARADCTTTNTHIQLYSTQRNTHTHSLSLSPASSRRLLLARSLLGHENSSIFPAVWKNACEIHSNQARIFTHGYHKNTRSNVVRVENANLALKKMQFNGSSSKHTQGKEGVIVASERAVEKLYEPFSTNDVNVLSEIERIAANQAGGKREKA